MYKLAGLLVAAAVLAGCAAPNKKNVQEQDWYAKEDSLRQAYKQCMAKSGNNASQCKKQKDALYEQMEWNLLEQSD